MNEPTVQKLMANTNKSKVAVVIPLYGFWKDSPDSQLVADVLQVALSRLRSSVHHMYFLFVGEAERLPKEVISVIAGHTAAGNTRGVFVPSFCSYGEYMKEGLAAALEDTDAPFVLFFNPWIVLKQDSVDQLIERVNRRDVAIASAYNVNHLVDAGQFDEYKIDLPTEERDLNLNFFGLTRQMAELINMDENLQSHYFIARDLWQNMFNRGFEVISSQFIPVYHFEPEWSALETVEQYEEDKQYFIKKWGFEPEIPYVGQQ